MDGTFHSNRESFDSHPRCKCYPAPKTKSWRELGFDMPDRRPAFARPGEKFDRLTEGDQRAVLGKAKYEAWAEGKIQLNDLVQRTYSDKWGGGRRERSLQDALS